MLQNVWKGWQNQTPLHDMIRSCQGNLQKLAKAN